jgi:hypothetical protein
MTVTTTTTTALLRRLERDFTGKRSVEDCLCHNSRAFPADLVQKLLRENIHNTNTSSSKASTTRIVLDYQAFHLSFLNLLTEHLAVAKIAYSASSSSSSSSSSSFQKEEQQHDDKDDAASFRSGSSLWYISKLSTVFYFMHLVWEFENCSPVPLNNANKPIVQEKDDDQDENASDPQHVNRPNSSASSSVSSSDDSISSSSPRRASSKPSGTTIAPPALLTLEQSNKMILQLLRGLTGVACTLCEKHYELQQQQQQQQQEPEASCESTSSNSTTRKENCNGHANKDDDNDDDCRYYTNHATQTFHGLQVASFIVMNLIRLNHYVRLRPVFISPLWKAIGEVVTALLPRTTTRRTRTLLSLTKMLIPRAIWVEGVTCLTNYLVEGTVPTLRMFTYDNNNRDGGGGGDLDRSELQQQQEQQQFQTKVLGFLLGRLAVFFKTFILFSPRQQAHQQLSSSSSSSSLQQQQEVIVTRVLENLCILRGVDHAPLASKVDRCIKALLLTTTSPPGGGSSSNDDEQQQQQQNFQYVVLQRLMQCSHKHAVQVLQRVNAAAAAAASDKDLIADLVTPFYFQGHCWLLLEPLQAALETTDIATTPKKDNGGENIKGGSWSSFLDKDVFLPMGDNAETLFRVMEHVVFCSLPACSQDLWSSTSENNSSSRAVAAAKKSSLKPLLLPRCLNLGWQLLLRYESFLICCSSDNQQQRRQSFHHLLACWLGRSEHPLAREVILMLVQGHVQNLLALEASVAEPLVRLLAKLLYDQRTKLQLRRGLARLFVRLLLHDAPQQQPTTGTSTVTFFAEQILVDELDKSSHLGTIPPPTTATLSTGSKRKRTKGKSSKPLTAADILVVGQVISMLPSDASSRRILTDCLQAGLEPHRLGPVTVALLRSDATSDEASTTVRDLVVKFSKLWSTQRRTKLNKKEGDHGTEKSSSSLNALGEAVFRYLYKSCFNSTELKPPQATVLVQAICRLFRCILDSNDNDGHLPSLKEPVVGVLLEGIRVLRLVNRALSSSTPSAVLDQLARIFHQLLSHNEWAVRAQAMSSLVLFASTVPPAHKQILPACLPTNMASLLQCRLKGSVPPGLTTSSTSDVLSLQRQCAQKLFSLVQFDACSIPAREQGSIFPTSSSSMVIPTGSLVLKMPTQLGRMAIVIFPPGEQSIEDINYMTGEGEEPYRIEKFHRMQSIQGGCKMYLRN